MGGKVKSQQFAAKNLKTGIMSLLDPSERQVLRDSPELGEIPRLDAIARFLSEDGVKRSLLDFSRRTSDQPSIDDCITALAEKVIQRMESYRGQNNTKS